MKKVLIVMVCLLTILLTGCNKEEKKVLVNNVSYTEIEQKIKNKDTFILEIVQTGCSNCASFTPTFESVLEKNNLTAYSINLLTITEDELKRFNEDFNVDGTPTVLFFKDGEESSSLKRIEGNVSEDVIITKFKANGFIK